MQLEAVGRVTVGDLCLEVGGQVDNVDGTERAFLRADTATDTEALGNEGDLGLGCHFDTKLACADHRARLFALLATFLKQVMSLVHRPSVNQRLLRLKNLPWACTIRVTTMAQYQRLLS